MNVSARRRFGAVAAIIAVGSPVISHLALALGQGYGAAELLAAVQAVATGVLLWTTLPIRRWAGPLVSLALLAALSLGGRDSPQAALLAMAGTAHAVLYSALLFIFATTLRSGHTALITRLAARLNPTFHAGMVPYTRKVQVAWTIFFAGQLVASAVLFRLNPMLWQSFVTILHVPCVVVMALGEAIVRRWRWRHEHSTSLLDTIRGTRRLLRRP